VSELKLAGLDGSNPLAFLAALGVLRAADDQVRGVRLSWREEGIWFPVLHDFDGDLDALLDLLEADLQDCADDPALALIYASKEEEVPTERDLKPPPAVFRQYLETLVEGATADHRRSVDWAAAFASDVVTDLGGKTKPSALHFTAGQQKFLGMVHQILEQGQREDLEEAICGPWLYDRNLPVLGWDNTVSRDYALRARDPSTDQKCGVPGADWLALRGLSFLVVVPRGDRLLTTCCTGGWKSGLFRWPLWTPPLPSEVIGSLLRCDMTRMSIQERLARGVGVTFECSIRRSDQGGYGSFTPSRPLVG
jgi:hypothetical protein